MSRLLITTKVKNQTGKNQMLGFSEMFGFVFQINSLTLGKLTLEMK